MHKKFDSEAVWHSFLRDDSNPNNISLFMAVPTIYFNLIKHYDDGKIQGHS
jgi:malonyl-CoA/methylmalonyl-CoA synthetase